MKKFFVLFTVLFFAADCYAWPLKGKWLLQQPEEEEKNFIESAIDRAKGAVVSPRASYMLEFLGNKIIIRYISPEKMGLIKKAVNKTYNLTSDLLKLGSSPDLPDTGDPLVNRLRTGIAAFNYQLMGNYIFIDTTQGYQVLEIVDRNTIVGSYLGTFKRINPLPEK